MRPLFFPFYLRFRASDADIMVLLFLQFSKGSVNGAERRGEEDHEALQHARPVEANLSRIEAAEALEA
jgi:hypothetical protein